MKVVKFTPYAMLLFIHLQFQHDIIHDLHLLAGLGKERTDGVAGDIGSKIIQDSFIGGGNDISEHKYNLKGGGSPVRPKWFDKILHEFFLEVMESIMKNEQMAAAVVVAEAAAAAVVVAEAEAAAAEAAAEAIDVEDAEAAAAAVAAAGEAVIGAIEEEAEAEAALALAVAAAGEAVIGAIDVEDADAVAAAAAGEAVIGAIEEAADAEAAAAAAADAAADAAVDAVENTKNDFNLILKQALGLIPDQNFRKKLDWYLISKRKLNTVQQIPWKEFLNQIFSRGNELYSKTPFFSYYRVICFDKIFSEQSDVGDFITKYLDVKDYFNIMNEVLVYRLIRKLTEQNNSDEEEAAAPVVDAMVDEEEEAAAAAAAEEATPVVDAMEEANAGESFRTNEREYSLYISRTIPDGIVVYHQLIINKNHILEILQYFKKVRDRERDQKRKKSEEPPKMWVADRNPSFLFFDDNTFVVPSTESILSNTPNTREDDKLNPVRVAGDEDSNDAVLIHFNIDNIQCSIQFTLKENQSDFDIFLQLDYTPLANNDAENLGPFVPVDNLYNLYFSYLGSERSDFYNIMARETIFSNFLSVTSNEGEIDLRIDDKSDREIAIEDIMRRLISKSQILKVKVNLETLLFKDNLYPPIDHIDIARLGYTYRKAVEKYIEYEDEEEEGDGMVVVAAAQAGMEEDEEEEGDGMEEDEGVDVEETKGGGPTTGGAGTLNSSFADEGDIESGFNSFYHDNEKQIDQVNKNKELSNDMKKYEIFKICMIKDQQNDEIPNYQYYLYIIREILSKAFDEMVDNPKKHFMPPYKMKYPAPVKRIWSPFRAPNVITKMKQIETPYVNKKREISGGTRTGRTRGLPQQGNVRKFGVFVTDLEQITVPLRSRKQLKPLVDKTHNTLFSRSPGISITPGEQKAALNVNKDKINEYIREFCENIIGFCNNGNNNYPSTIKLGLSRTNKRQAGKVPPDSLIDTLNTINGMLVSLRNGDVIQHFNSINITIDNSEPFIDVGNSNIYKENPEYLIIEYKVKIVLSLLVYYCEVHEDKDKPIEDTDDAGAPPAPPAAPALSAPPAPPAGAAPPPSGAPGALGAPPPGSPPPPPNSATVIAFAAAHAAHAADTAENILKEILKIRDSNSKDISQRELAAAATAAADARVAAQAAADTTDAIVAADAVDAALDAVRNIRDLAVAFNIDPSTLNGGSAALNGGGTKFPLTLTTIQMIIKMIASYTGLCETALLGKKGLPPLPDTCKLIFVHIVNGPIKVMSERLKNLVYDNTTGGADDKLPDILKKEKELCERVLKPPKTTSSHGGSWKWGSAKKIDEEALENMMNLFTQDNDADIGKLTGGGDWEQDHSFGILSQKVVLTNIGQNQAVLEKNIGKTSDVVAMDDVRLDTFLLDMPQSGKPYQDGDSPSRFFYDNAANIKSGMLNKDATICSDVARADAAAAGSCSPSGWRRDTKNDGNYETGEMNFVIQSDAKDDTPQMRYYVEVKPEQLGRTKQLKIKAKLKIGDEDIINLGYPEDPNPDTRYEGLTIDFADATPTLQANNTLKILAEHVLQESVGITHAKFLDNLFEGTDAGLARRQNIMNKAIVKGFGDFLQEMTGVLKDGGYVSSYNADDKVIKHTFQPLPSQDQPRLILSTDRPSATRSILFTAFGKGHINSKSAGGYAYVGHPPKEPQRYNATYYIAARGVANGNNNIFKPGPHILVSPSKTKYLTGPGPVPTFVDIQPGGNIPPANAILKCEIEQVMKTYGSAAAAGGGVNKKKQSDYEKRSIRKTKKNKKPIKKRVNSKNRKVKRKIKNKTRKYKKPKKQKRSRKPKPKP